MKVSRDLREAFRDRGEIRQLAKGTALLMQGDVSRHAYFVESGCLRLWYVDEGADISVKFFLQGELCASLDSYFRSEPSRYGIEAIRPTVVRVCTKQTIQTFMDQSPQFKDYIDSVIVHCMADYQDLFANRISKSPEARYRALCEEDPDVLDIVPLHYIASYLGITSVSLSRIRQKVDRS